MHASDVVETLPAAGPDDNVLSAVRMVCQNGLPGLVVTGERGEVVGCISATDLLWLVLPRYMREDPSLARVFDEEHADHIADVLVGTRVRDMVGDHPDGVPIARPQATVVELAELMARRCSPLVLVQEEQGNTLGIVTANRVLELLVSAAEGAS